MHQSFMHSRDDRGAYEYTIQPTEDPHEGPTEDGPGGRDSPVWRSESTIPNYKPTPLRWPFISVVMALLVVAIVLVVVAEKQMPDSDSSARILGIHPNASQPERLRFARAARAVLNDTSSASTVEEKTGGDPTPSTTLEATTTPSQTRQSSSASEEEAEVLAQSSTSTDSQIPTTSPVPASTVSESAQPSSSASTATTTSPLSVSSQSTRPPSTAQSSTATLPASISSQSTQSPNEAQSSTLTTTLPASISSQSAQSTSSVQPSAATTATPSSLAPSTSSSATLSKDTTLSGSSSHASGSTGIMFQNAASGSSTTTPAVTGTTTSDSVTSTASLPSGARVVPVISVSKFTSNVTIPVTTVTFTSTFSSDETVVFTTSTTFVSTIVSTMTSTRSPLPTTLETQFSTVSGPQNTATETGGIEVHVTTMTATMTSGSVGVTTRPTFGTSIVTSTITGVVIPTTGEITITSFSTIFPPGEAMTTQDHGPGQVTQIIDVVDGSSVPVVQTQGPVIVVVTDGDAKTQVIEQQQVTTGVVQVGGSVVTTVVVITPTSGNSAGLVTVAGGTPVTVVNSPDPVTAVTVIDGTQRTIVETPPPQTVVRVDGGVPTTIPPGQPVTNTVVDNVGGTPVTRVVVTTPAGPPFVPITYTVVRHAEGTLVTEAVTTTPTAAGQPVTFTAVDVVGGTPVTRVVVTTADGAGFQPVTYTVATNVGGTPTVVTVTPDPTTIVETINGTPFTRVTTPPVTSFTATVGGTLTTQILTTTPTGTEPITLTLVTTSGGTLSTFTSSLPPTSFLTTISGTLRTITSTPSPSTSFSTLPKSTRTLTSTTSPTTTAQPPPSATVIPSTRVYRWTEADIFIGTFLPALLGVALVIPLRIIDLNAKLYQPFQSLAKQSLKPQILNQPGSTGADTLLLQYTGLMAFITPAVTLLQGHPVPLLTTLMVGCASFMVPLATEAIGLKLHGECYLNTASSRCGPALGVSPVPAHALVGLMGAVVVMLAVVMFLVGRWVTGVWANPWSIAGIASLARCEAVRIAQRGEKGMRRAVAERRYGLGYFRDEVGREEYGIVLMDEEGRGLRRGEGDGSRGETESELLDDEGLMAKWGGRSQQLPFMTLRYPWRIAFVLFQLAVFIFVVYYHAYYRGGIQDNGRLWLFLNSNTFGVRFVAAVIGVIIAFCWQAFFLSVSQMNPFYLLSGRTQPPGPSILYTPATNPFSGIYSAVRHRQPFLFAVSLAAILSEFLPVILSNVPFNLAQTGAAATACAVLSCLFLGVMLAVLAASFFVRYPPMPVDPRCVAGLMWYVSKSRMLEDFEGVSRLERKEMEVRVKEMGRRYFYGILISDADGRRLGVDCDAGGGGEDGMAYQGAQGVLRGAERSSVEEL